MTFLKTIFRHERATARDPGLRQGPHVEIIQGPRLGMLNLRAGASTDLLRHDRAALGALFTSVEASEQRPPSCDVLFIYSDIESDGTVRGSASTLRTIVEQSGAVVVVLASENPGDNYVAVPPNSSDGVNLVMTIERRGDVFTEFFQTLFRQMLLGVPMPVAWVALAPQVPGDEHRRCPGTIFAAGAGQVAFS
jgi:hypothetical protein